MQLLELGGNVAGYIKVDRKDNTIDHSSTDNEAFIYYVHGPADPRLNSSELLEVIPVEWKCDGAFYGAADGVCTCKGDCSSASWLEPSCISRPACSCSTASITSVQWCSLLSTAGW